MDMIGSNIILHYEPEYGYMLTWIRDNKVVYRGEYHAGIDICMEGFSKTHWELK